MSLRSVRGFATRSLFDECYRCLLTSNLMVSSFKPTRFSCNRKDNQLSIGPARLAQVFSLKVQRLSVIKTFCEMIVACAE